MVSKPMIEGKFDEKVIRRYADSLRGRGAAIKRLITSQIASSASKEIKSRAPKDEDLRGYHKNLTVFMVKSEQVRYAVLHFGQTDMVDGLDAKTTLLYVRPSKRKQGRHAAFFRVLQRYAPFTLDTWPVKVPKNRAFVVYRKASERDVRQARDRNRSEFGDLREQMAKAGLRMKRSDFEVKNVSVVSDLAHLVLRAEFGVGRRKAAHWRPGLVAAASATNLNTILNDPRLKLALLDPHYQGWHRLGIMNRKVDPSKLKSTDDFQRKITGG